MPVQEALSLYFKQESPATQAALRADLRLSMVESEPKDLKRLSFGPATPDLSVDPQGPLEAVNSLVDLSQLPVGVPDIVEDLTFVVAIPDLPVDGQRLAAVVDSLLKALQPS